MSTKTEDPYIEQIMRFSGLQYFPAYPQGVKELRDTLKAVAGSAARAARIVARVLDDRETCPTPKDLKAVAAVIVEAEDSAPGSCSDCKGQPWVMKETGMGRCSCPKGRWLAEKDRERAVRM